MQKSVSIDSLGLDVIIARRKGTRSMRLSIKSDGIVRLSVPYMVSDRQAINFIEQKSEWIIQHYKKPIVLINGVHIGKSHRIVFETSNVDKIKTRLTPNVITIKLPPNVESSSNSAQVATRKACERALKIESENLLPQRLEVLAKAKGINYKTCTVKKLKSRWGSCDNHKNIILNIYLIQIDWRLIDYVILHELAHTKHQNHQAEFWNYLEELIPDCKQRRKELKQIPTDIIPTSF